MFKKFIGMVLMVLGLAAPSQAQEQKVDFQVGAEQDIGLPGKSFSNQLVQNVSYDVNAKTSLGVDFRQQIRYMKNARPGFGVNLQPYAIRSVGRKSFVGFGGEVDFAGKRSWFLGAYPIVGTGINKKWSYLTIAEGGASVANGKYTGTLLITGHRFTRKLGNNASGYLQGAAIGFLPKGGKAGCAYSFKIGVMYRLPPVKVKKGPVL